MAKTSGRLGGGYDYFICQLSRKSKQTMCTRHSIRYDDLKSIIEQRVAEIINRYTSNEEEFLCKNIYKEDSSNKVNNLNSKRNKCLDKIDEINRSITAAYQDKVKGLLCEGDFVRIITTLHEVLDPLDQEEKSIMCELEYLEGKEKSEKSLVKDLPKQYDSSELTNELVNEFIECIYIGEKVGAEQRIVIDWKI
jgi:hypothetical protein